MMRSGQYKMSGVGSRASGAEVVINQFKPMKHEFNQATSASKVDKSRKSKVDLSSSECTDLKSQPKTYKIYSEKTHALVLEAVETRSSPTRKVSSQRKTLSKALNKSCENLISPMNAVNRVEQKVKNLLHRGDSKHKQDEKDHNEKEDDSWQYGHLITLPRRNRRSLALSNSTISSFSDTASCVSGSSGYSSSSSSSCYGSFKSSSSASSTLLRKKSSSESISDRSISQCSNEPRETLIQPHSILVDNPMYDITPAMARLYGTPSTVTHCDYPGSPSSPCSKQNGGHVNPIYELPQEVKNQIATTDKPDILSCLEESGLGMECSDSDDTDDMENIKMPQEDPVARECRQYFEQRLKNSKQLKKRWSLSSSDSGADSGDNEVLPYLNSNSPETSEMPVQYKSSESKKVDDSVDNLCSKSNISISNTSSDSCIKSPLDMKMDFLRKEIAGLMKQDNALFRQLLTLHDSIEALRTQQSPLATQHHQTLQLNWAELNEEQDGSIEALRTQQSPLATQHHQTLQLNWAELNEEQDGSIEALRMQQQQQQQQPLTASQHHQTIRLNWAALTEEEEEEQDELEDQCKRTEELNNALQTYSSKAIEEQLEDLEDEGLEVDRSISLSPSPHSSSIEDSSSLNSLPSFNSAHMSGEDNISFSPLSSLNSGSISLSSSPNSTLSSERDNSSLSSSPIEDDHSYSILDTPNSTVAPPSPNLSISSANESCLLSVTYSPNSLLSHAEDNLLLSPSISMSTASTENMCTVNSSENPDLYVSSKEDHLTSFNSSITSKSAIDTIVEGNKETQESNTFPSCSNNFISDTSKTRYPKFLLDTESSNIQSEKVNSGQQVKTQFTKFNNLKIVNIEEKENSDHDEANGFVRNQRSYAPNARNRRRSSSVNHKPSNDGNQRNSMISTADHNKIPSRIPCLTNSSKAQIRERTSSSPFPLNGGNSSTKYSIKLQVLNNSSTKLHEKKSLRCSTEAANSSPHRQATQSKLRPLPRPPYREALIM